MNGSFENLISETERLIRIGKQESKTPKSDWKYTLNDGDLLAIPVLQFNIETNYENLEGQQFYCGKTTRTVRVAYQRTALKLNETGAEVESEAMSMTDSAGAFPNQLPKPKILTVDKPYCLFLAKRQDKLNPYLAVRILNAELMTKHRKAF